MKNLFVLILLCLSLSLFAHEGGHGSVSESGKFGGVMSPIVSKSESEKGEKAKTLYKAELVRSESGKLSLYIFDEKMNLIGLEEFSEEIISKLEIKKKGKYQYFGEFKMKKSGTHYSGQLPKVEYKPFNIDFYFKDKKTELFVGFSNLD